MHSGLAAQATRGDDGTVLRLAWSTLTAKGLKRVVRLLTHVVALLLRLRVGGVTRFVEEDSEKWSHGRDGGTTSSYTNPPQQVRSRREDAWDSCYGLGGVVGVSSSLYWEPGSFGS